MIPPAGIAAYVPLPLHISIGAGPYATALGPSFRSGRALAELRLFKSLAGSVLFVGPGQDHFQFVFEAVDFVVDPGWSHVPGVNRADSSLIGYLPCAPS